MNCFQIGFFEQSNKTHVVSENVMSLYWGGWGLTIDLQGAEITP